MCHPRNILFMGAVCGNGGKTRNNFSVQVLPKEHLVDLTQGIMKTWEDKVMFVPENCINLKQ